jgi:hypothetical protein
MDRSDQLIARQALRFRLRCFDLDVPPQPLTFSLAPLAAPL